MRWLRVLCIALALAFPSTSETVVMVGFGQEEASACNFDFLETAAHAYLIDAATWNASGDDIPDECADGGRSCSTQDILTTTSLDDTDLSTANMPSGTGSGKVKLVFSTTGDFAFVAAPTNDLFQTAAHTDWMACAWVDIHGSFDIGGDIMFDGTGTGGTNMGAFCGETGEEGEGRFSTVDDSAQFQTTAGDIPCDATADTVGGWVHICYGVDNDGSAGGSDTRYIWINGESNSDTDVANGVAENEQGFRNSTGDQMYDIHEAVMFHGTVLTQQQVCDLMLCGADDSADPSARDTQYDAGANCTPPT